MNLTNVNMCVYCLSYYFVIVCVSLYVSTYVLLVHYTSDRPSLTQPPPSYIFLKKFSAHQKLYKETELSCAKKI